MGNYLGGSNMKNKYEIRGELTAIFVRCHGKIQECLIDTEDLILAKSIGKHKSWFGYYEKNNDSFYITSTKPYIRIHRLITKCNIGEVIDHRDHNTLDNRKNNLLKTSNAGNNQNKKGSYKGNKSGYRGVQWNEVSKKWKAGIQVNKKAIHLGHFDTPEQANDVVMQARARFMPLSIEAQEIKQLLELPDVSRKKQEHTSDVKGVSWTVLNSKWSVRKRVDGKDKLFGLFTEKRVAEYAMSCINRDDFDELEKLRLAEKQLPRRQFKKKAN